jgi:D-alanyl-D-alanine carboxypeptidase (penicillin-binding protein 5/6)
MAVEITAPPPDIKASGHILIDFASGNVLAEKNTDKRLEPASLTKIITAHVIFHELKTNHLALDEKVAISETAWRQPGSRMFIEAGKQVSVEELLKGMIIQSGNDASVALAEHVAGSEAAFAELMNKHAKKLGMTASHFVNATGLPHADHYTTARDIAKAAAATIRDFPEYYAWYKVKSFEFNKIKQYNRNKLLWKDESVDGMKTGHTEAAGYCLVASAKRHGVRLLSVVLGTESIKARTKESQTLLNYGFRSFETRKLYAAGQPITKAKVWKGDKETVELGLAEDFFVTASRSKYDQLKPQLHIPKHIEAPIQKGQQIGEIRIMLQGNLVKSTPLISFDEIQEGGFFSTMKDGVMLWMD